jgi:hypothetical protein
MKKSFIITIVTGLSLSLHVTGIAQIPLPPQVSIWDGNKVGKITNKAGLKYTLDYIQTLRQQVQAAVQKGLTLEQTKQTVTMKEYDKGYVLFNWLHFNFNLPNAYKDISNNKEK